MILDNYQTIGIASDENKLKLAAIFFDKVYNIDKGINVPSSLTLGTDIDTKKFDDIAENIKSKFDTDYKKIFNEKLLPEYFKDKNEVDRNTVIEILTKAGNESRAKTFNLFAIEAAKQLSANQNNIGIPIFNETILFDHLENDYINNLSQEKVEVSIINGPVIIASELDWKQIAEAKRDSDFNSKVRRFSVFINKNYTGRELPYIIDDLSIQIEDYKNACNKHGIRLVNETFKSLTNSKSLFGTLGVTFFALLAKMPEYALVSGAVGASLEVLNLKITVRQYEDKFESFVKESPISLIFEIEKMKKGKLN
jgi:hypothetical protein